MALVVYKFVLQFSFVLGRGRQLEVGALRETYMQGLQKPFGAF